MEYAVFLSGIPFTSTGNTITLFAVVTNNNVLSGERDKDVALPGRL